MTDFVKRRLFSEESNPGGGSSSVTPTNILNSALVTLFNAGTMVPGFYNITDAADRGVVIQAISPTQLAEEGQGIFINMDFQGIGNYSGVIGVTGIAYTSTVGVWDVNSEVGYTDGMIVFSQGSHYQVIDRTLFDGTGPTVNTSAYTILQPIVPNVGYIFETDTVEYHLGSNGIILRKDRRGNVVYGKASISAFQWGNNSVSFNKVYSSDEVIATIDCLDSLCSSIVGNFIESGIQITNIATMSAGGTFINNRFKNSNKIGNTPSIISMYGVTAIVTFNDNTVECTGDTIDFLDNSQGFFIGETLLGENSTFRHAVDLAGSSTLDLGSAASYAGRIDIQDTTAITASIDLVTTVPDGRTIRVYPDLGLLGAGLVITFINGTGANQPNCIGGVNTAVNSIKEDWIEFTKQTRLSGTFKLKQTNIGTY